MGKRLKHTPRGAIKVALQRLWLRSRERSAAIKRDKYTCQGCNRKQSKAKGKEFKVQVHHKGGVQNWETLIDLIYQYLLCPPEDLITLCKECHGKEHAEKPKRKNIFG